MAFNPLGKDVYLEIKNKLRLLFFLLSLPSAQLGAKIKAIGEKEKIIKINIQI